mmetsp:Transcript_24003/g.51891  ORF Transcript_24003/g.51891 Transcript_24003/m.51891 type:complete len:81 (+) Transcript_24003:1371-1613(+)
MNVQAAVAALLLMKLMARRTHKLSSHYRSVLGDKGYTQHAVGKGIYKGPNPSPLDKQITDRKAQIRKIQAIQCCALSSNS